MRNLTMLLIASFLISTSAQAEEKPASATDYAAVLSMMAELVGGSVDAKTESGQRVISVTVDRNKVNRDFEKFQALKLLNPDITQTFIATHQNPAALAIATQLAVMAVITEYRTQKTDKCAFVTSSSYPTTTDKLKRYRCLNSGSTARFSTESIGTISTIQTSRRLRTVIRCRLGQRLTSWIRPH